MFFNSIFSENYKEEMKEAEIVLNLQFFIDTSIPPTYYCERYSFNDNHITPKLNNVNDILNHCNKICEHILDFDNNHIYKNSKFDKKDFSICSLIAVYNTVCELLSNNYIKRFGYKKLSEKSKYLNDNETYFFYKNKVFKKDKNRYLYKAINEHINPQNVSKNKLSFFSHELILNLMFDFNSYDINTYISRISHSSRWDRFENNIFSYLQYYNILRKTTFLNKIESDNYVIDTPSLTKLLENTEEFSKYLNHKYVFESLYNIDIFEDILSCALYILYNGYGLIDYVIDSFIKIMDIPSIYLRNRILFIFFNRLFTGKDVDFDYFGSLKSNAVMTYLYKSFADDNVKYTLWGIGFRNAVELFSRIIIPIYDNTLFILLYKFYEQNPTDIKPNDVYTNPDNTLLLMKREIEKCLMEHLDIIFGEKRWGFNYNNDKWEIVDTIIPTYYNPKGIHTVDGINYKNSNAENIRCLLDKIKNKQSVYKKESLKDFLNKLFTHMEKKPVKKRYNITKNTFSFRTTGIPNDSYCDQLKYVKQIIAAFTEAKTLKIV